MPKKRCKQIEIRIKEIETKNGNFYVNEYKCTIKGGKHETSIKRLCRKCPLQLELF